MPEEIIVNKRFCGPPTSGNGGYVCGLLSRYITGDAEARLFKPIALDKPLKVRFKSTDHVLLEDGETIVAEAYATEAIRLDIPPPPTYEEAMHASTNYIGFKDHIFPTCFVCGPQRKGKDGLRIFAGKTGNQDLVAAGWIPDGSLADGEGRVERAFIWAALDCPGAFAVSCGKLPPIVLGTLAVKIENGIAAGEKTVVTGWKIGEDGRKVYAGTAIFSAAGQLHAVGRATWIRLKQ